MDGAECAEPLGIGADRGSAIMTGIMELLPPIPPGEPTKDEPKTKPGITIRFDSDADLESWVLLASVYNLMDAVRGQKRKRKWSASSVLKLAADTYLADVKKRLGAWPSEPSEQEMFLADVRRRAEKEEARRSKPKK
jgi:hypothetical protein